MAPATSNTVAKCVAGISDNLVTNVFAQAGKCRVPVIVYACDTKPVHDTMAPGGMVRLWPRRVDLENTERLKAFEATTVVEDMAELERAVTARLAEVRPAPIMAVHGRARWRPTTAFGRVARRAGRDVTAALSRPACLSTSSS